ncbi:MAG: hypothetical protein LBC89_02850 [Bacteroidales bacterium]|nr:hypothetical protein [Bacteroidales bacterium]
MEQKKTLNFRYCNYLRYNLIAAVSLVVLFGIFLLCLYFMKNIVPPVIWLIVVMIGFIFIA